jgi:hypothetical protein
MYVVASYYYDSRKRKQEYGDSGMWRRLLVSNAPAAVCLIRLMVGAVFLSEGIQKFLFADQLGA